MSKIYSLTVALFIFSCSFLQISAQGTFTQIHQILQTNCAGSSCHQSGGNPSFDVNASESALYSQLVNANPINPYAKDSAKNKLITPGYPDRSFLLRKIAHGLNENNPHLTIKQPHEGATMPDGGGALSKPEIELIRQWILFGAPQTGNVVDTSVINKYYSGKGKDDTYSNHTPPAPGQGFQIYVGKLLIPASTELYYYIKHNPRLSSAIEIPRVVTMLPASTHHFVIFKFQPGQSGIYNEGLRPENESSHASVLDGIGTGPNLWDYDLPGNSAYFWEQSTILDLNLHIRNSLIDTVLGCDLYINVYTQPLGTTDKYMLIRNFPVFTIAIPPDGLEHEFVEVANDTNETHYWNVWQLYGHTHQWGTDYDIFLRNPDGSMGAQQYESWYSYEQGFNVGYHRYGVDATFRYYPDNALLQVDPRLGWIHRARYKNNTQDTIFWGLTSNEEMMVMGFQYLPGDTLGALPSNILSSQSSNLRVNVFPNPASDVVMLNYALEKPADVTVQLSNVLGEVIPLYTANNKSAGNYLDEVNIPAGISRGIYFITIRAGTQVNTQRIIIE
ncbi:MAG: T9SS type A sorting domain-containing protein [Chitinophagales bacterium]|nr:T9SS type A sorting domain-containing protein [Chitinophagales bacterium]